jgi:integrase
VTREQTRELLAVPGRSTLEGKRKYVILSLLVGCALREERTGHALGRGQLVARERLVIATREGRAAGSGSSLSRSGSGLVSRRGRLPLASIGHGCCVRSRRSDWLNGKPLIGVENFGAHRLRRTCAKLCRKAGGDLEQIKFLFGRSFIQTTERYLGFE